MKVADLQALRKRLFEVVEEFNKGRGDDQAGAILILAAHCIDSPSSEHTHLCFASNLEDGMQVQAMQHAISRVGSGS